MSFVVVVFATGSGPEMGLTGYHNYFPNSGALESLICVVEVLSKLREGELSQLTFFSTFGGHLPGVDERYVCGYSRVDWKIGGANEFTIKKTKCRLPSRQSVASPGARSPHHSIKRARL